MKGMAHGCKRYKFELHQRRRSRSSSVDHEELAALKLATGALLAVMWQDEKSLSDVTRQRSDFVNFALNTPREDEDGSY